MKDARTDRIVDDYLRRLNAALKDLPKDRREELVEEIREHIEVGRAELGSETEAELRSLLDRIGDPSDIAADSADRLGVRPVRVGLMEIAAVVLLPIGGVVVPFVGWVVGVILLWASKAWDLRDKLIGTFLLPGGLLLPAYLLLGVGSTESCATIPGPAGGTSGDEVTTCIQGGPAAWAIAAIVILVVAPIASAAYLAIRLHRHRAASG
jgi:hypothetical protein